MSVTILRGNALALGLADESVDLIVTSPPYFGLRSYQDGGQHYAGQIGDEPTPAEFVDALIAATAEMVRVLKPSGSIWVNLGDKYASSSNGTIGHRAASRDRTARASSGNDTGVATKSLIGIPWRYAIRCIDDLGLILRAEVIWSKPNGLPESVTDRVRRSHEQWFHFTREPRYFSAVDEIREAHNYAGKGLTWEQRKATGNRYDATGHVGHGSGGMEANPLGKLPGSVWTIPTEPLHVPESLGIDHFAAFPTEWPRRIIQGWSPSGICTECGEGRRPVADKASGGRGRADAGDGGRGDRLPGYADVNRSGWTEGVRYLISGQECACGVFDGQGLHVVPDLSQCERERHVSGAGLHIGSDGDAKSSHATSKHAPPTRPAVVLDPFGGTGTVALVAKALGRHGISNDMSADYCRLAEWRTTDPKQLAKAARRPFVPPAEQTEGQLDLLEGIA